MHILFEADLLGSQKHIGISNSILQLIYNLARSKSLLSVFHKNETSLFNEFPNIFEPNQNKLPPAEHPTQILHSFTLTNPQHRSLPWVQTIFDTIIEHYPAVLKEVYPNIDTKVAKLLRRTAKMIAQEPQLIIAPSENTKKDLINIYKIPDSRIKVIPLAPHPVFQKIDALSKEQFIKKQGLDFPFLLFVGPRWKHKNFSTLLRAFAIIKKKTTAINQQLKLIAIGSSPQLNKEEETLINKHKLQKEIKIIPYVNHAELNLWYNTAALLAYPSLYEGFGLPPLEAMACDLPVVAAKSSSLPEIIADAALFFSPHNAVQLAEMIQNLLYDKPLRKKLIAQGRKQIKYYSWENIAKETLKAYEQLLQK
ncbi:glycosyltransferase family 4 protein [Candidatus Margulisiibacteriota bacterium]